MKKITVLIGLFFLTLVVNSQTPQKFSYQAVIRNAAGKLVMNSSVGIKLSILQGSFTGTVVYSETHATSTNVNGLVTIEVGGGTTSGNFNDIDWGNGPYFLKTETDPSGGTNYSITGVSQLLSVPYALYSQKAANGFSGDYNDLSNKPVTDGSETKIAAGTNMSVSGTGTIDSPYLIDNGFSGDYNDLINKPVTDGSETKIVAGANTTVSGLGTIANPYQVNATNSSSLVPKKVIITSTQTWTVPATVSKITVDLWGAAGGGGGAGAYSYSYYLNDGGYGGSGGYAKQEFDVTANQQFDVVIGTGGAAGINAINYYPYWYFDTDGGDGGDSWFATMKAAGGTGGKRGSYSYNTVNGTAGTVNYGTITGYSSDPKSNVLDVFQGLERSYINDRYLTSKSGKGGSITGYSSNILPTAGEGGCAIITFFE